MNVFLILQMAADAMGDRVALVAGETRWTYADLAAAARRAAARVGPDRRLAYLAENDPAAPAALFGAALAGVPYVPVNYRLASDQIDALLARVAPALLVADGVDGPPGVEVVSRARVLEGAPSDSEPTDDADAVAVELFTSGTTGAPKSAMLRHGNLMSYILSTVEFMSAAEEEATLIAAPPYHIAGVSAILSATYAGRRMVQAPAFAPRVWLDLAAREAVTHAFLVPTMLQRIVEEAQAGDGAPDLPALRAIAYGGGKMPLAVIEAAMELFPHVEFTNAYGLTETSSTICLLGPDEHRAAKDASDPSVRRRLASVGRPLPSIELQVRDEAGNPCATEAAGLVFVRGAQVSGEYREAGSQLDADGWFPTRDRGFVDEEGYLFLDGRADDVIVRGGENISPGEVEDALLTHPCIRDAAAVAAPDEEWGEAVGVALVLAPDAAPPSDDDIRAHVRDRLRSSRVPTVIKIVDELPYNETGKLLRRVIRDEFARDAR